MSDENLETRFPPGPVKFHHVGFVVSSIQESGKCFGVAIGATWDGNLVFDPIQKVRVAFLRGSCPTDPLIELVEPGGPESPVSRFLERRGGLHHLCYEVADLERHLKFCQSADSIIMQTPVPAVAFAGRRIAWILTAKNLVVELLEA